MPAMTRNLRASLAAHGPALFAAAAGFLLWQYWGNATHGYIASDSLWWWWGVQWVDPHAETEHGWMILALGVWLFWRNARREPVAPNPPDTSRAAAAMAAGLGVHLLGYGVQQTRLSILGALLYAWGVAVLAGGRRWGRAAAFPLAFLVFAIPLNVLDTAGFWLRLWVIDASHTLAHLAGIDVVRNGTQLFAPDGSYQYDVAAACSGVRSLMALAALSLLVGYLNFRSWWLRLLVFLLSLPFTYLGNVVRISAIIFAAQWFGRDAGLAVHEWAGFLVFVIVLGLELLSVRWLAGRFPAAVTRPAPRPDEPFLVAPAGRPPRSAATMIAVFVMVALTVAAVRELDRIPVRSDVGVRLAADGRDPVPLPAFIGTDWIGRTAEVTSFERQLLPPDTGFSRRTYAALHQPGHQVFLSIVLSGRDRTSIHRPEICVVGQGWTIRDGRRHDFRLPVDPSRALPATVLDIEHATGRDGRTYPSVLAYWFVSSNRVVGTHWERMLWGAWDRLRHGRADRWAYVLLQTDATDGQAAALARIQEVIDGTFASFETTRP